MCSGGMLFPPTPRAVVRNALCAERELCQRELLLVLGQLGVREAADKEKTPLRLGGLAETARGSPFLEAEGVLSLQSPVLLNTLPGSNTNSPGRRKIIDCVSYCNSKFFSLGPHSVFGGWVSELLGFYLSVALKVHERI